MALKRLKAEYVSIEKDENAPLYEDIGNNILRINLKALKPYELEPLFEAFIKSAEMHKGNLESFKEKLNLLWENFSDLNFNFTKDELKNYLKEYEKENFPMVSHSRIYNEYYFPSYRIIDRRILK